MSDLRHDRRVALMKSLFAHTFSDSNLNICLQSEGESIVKKICQSLEELDNLIRSVAPERPIDQINKVDLAILRLIVFESKHKKTPKKVLLNEAVELAKEFGTESSSKFVNGVLAKLLIEEERYEN